MPKKIKIPKIEIEINDSGFTVWVIDKVNVLGKIRKIRHWVLDGSLINENAVIALGQKDMYPTEARYNEQENIIVISTNPRKG